jgi:hypothetical protein
MAVSVAIFGFRLLLKLLLPQMADWFSLRLAACAAPPISSGAWWNLNPLHSTRLLLSRRRGQARRSEVEDSGVTVMYVVIVIGDNPSVNLHSLSCSNKATTNHPPPSASTVTACLNSLRRRVDSVVVERDYNTKESSR